MGTELLSYFVDLAKREGLGALTAEAPVENEAMLRVFRRLSLPTETTASERTFEVRISLK